MRGWIGLHHLHAEDGWNAYVPNARDHRVQCMLSTV